MKITSDLADGYWNKDVSDFLDNLHRATEALNTLAQIQSIAGTAMMQHRAHQTENILAYFLNVLPDLRRACDEDARRMKERKR